MLSFYLRESRTLVSSSAQVIDARNVPGTRFAHLEEHLKKKHETARVIKQ
jgi:ribosome biogenesis GTPase A